MVRCVLVRIIAWPFFEQCNVDTAPPVGKAKQQRARAYMVQTANSYCAVVQVKMELYLMIDNVTEADAGAYNCTAGIILQQNVIQTVYVTTGTYYYYYLSKAMHGSTPPILLFFI